jgi:hypothetical protein
MQPIGTQSLPIMAADANHAPFIFFAASASG